MKKLLILGLLLAGLSGCGGTDTITLEREGGEEVTLETEAETNDTQDETLEIIQDCIAGNGEACQEIVNGDGNGDNSSEEPFVRPESITRHLPWITCEEIDTVLELKECEEADIRVFEYDFIGDELDVGTKIFEFKGNGDGDQAIFERDSYSTSNSETRQLVERLIFSETSKKVIRELHVKVWQDWSSSWVWYSSVSHRHNLRLVIEESDLSVSIEWISGPNKKIVDTL